MRYIYTTDEHLTNKQPKNRTDNYLDSMLKKLTEVVDYANENKITRWLSGGDFFDNSIQNSSLINRVIEVLKKFKTDQPISVIPGNHLIRGNAERSIANSGLATLEAAGLVSIKDDPCVITDPDSGLKIMMWHETIVKDPLPWDHLTFEQASEQVKGKADYVLCSHYHAYQGNYLAKNGVTFLSPGSLARGMGNEVDMTRPPRFLDLTLTKTGCEIRYIKVAADNPHPFKARAIKDSLDKKTDELVEYIRDNLTEFKNTKVTFEAVLDMLIKSGKVSEKSSAYLRKLYLDMRDEYVAKA